MKSHFLRHSILIAASFLFLLTITDGVNAATAFGVTTTNQLVRFDSATPGTTVTVGTITGLQTGENILGIDIRPATGQIYAIGSTSRLYIINRATGVATQVGTAGAFTLTGTEFGFDFNPVPDRIRVVSNTGQNIRLNPNDGTLAGTDTALNPGTPTVTAAAYTNSFGGATTTTLYVIDTAADTLNLQGSINGTPTSPNAGTLTSVGALGFDVTATNGFDIQPGSGIAFAALQVAGELTSKLFTVNLSTGAATLVGVIGAATPLRGLTVQSGSPASGRTVLDFDGDGRTDMAVLRFSNNTRYINRSSNNSFYSFQFGLTSDIETPGDYDGDGLADTAVWRPSNGVFYVLRSSNGALQTYQFGLSGDEPVARDYDGDGKTDFAVVRRTATQMVWYINNSATNTFRIETFGLNSDVTAPGDYDGDGRFDLATYRNQSGNGVFYIQRSTLGYQVVQFGLFSDLVVPGDYDGDGKTDFAVVRQGSSYTWFILRSSDGGFSSPQLGSKGDFTVQGDYDGDGRTDVAVFRPFNGTFYVHRSTTGIPTFSVFGQNGDYPIANYDTH